VGLPTQGFALLNPGLSSMAPLGPWRRQDYQVPIAIRALSSKASHGRRGDHLNHTRTPKSYSPKKQKARNCFRALIQLILF